MQDEEKQTELLNRMKASPEGSITVRRHLGMSPDARHEIHQIEQLCEMGLATMKSESMIRITAAGYRQLDAPEGDYGKQIELLNSMKDSPDGSIIVERHIGMSPDKRREVHQIELLCDMGLARMKSESMVGITHAGYRHLDV